MLKKIKQKKLKKIITKNLTNRDISQRNKKIKTLGFLIDESLQINDEELYNFSKEFNLQYKDIKIFKYIQLKKKVPTLQDNQVSNKDFSWNGTLKNVSAQEFLNRNFDMLVVLQKDKNVYIDYMVSQSKAKFKVGLTPVNIALFDLIIQLKPTQLELFKTELEKYLTALNKL